MTLSLAHQSPLLDFLSLFLLVVRVLDRQAPNVKVITNRRDDIVLQVVSIRE